MKKLSAVMIAVSVSALAFLATGCASTATAKSPRVYEVAGPVNVTGPVTVSGPITVNKQTKGHAPTDATSANRGALKAPAAPAAAAAPDGSQLELKKEQAAVAKQVVPNGQVSIKKVVVSETVTLPVTLNHDEYLIERLPATGEPTTAFGEAEISLPLQKETAAAVITPKVVEVIRLKKVIVPVTSNVTATIRTEKIETPAVQAP